MTTTLGLRSVTNRPSQPGARMPGRRWGTCSSASVPSSRASGLCSTNYRNRRADAARWLQQFFSDFHLDDEFKEIRTALEYDYDSVVGPLVERRITDRGVPLSEDDRRLLLELDTLLNYFEHVLYLEAEGHLNTRDRQRSTNNWFEIMSSDHMTGTALRGALRLHRPLQAPRYALRSS
jgi:hypothetical protein